MNENVNDEKDIIDQRCNKVWSSVSDHPYLSCNDHCDCWLFQ